MINSGRAVDLMVADWKSQGLPKAEIVVNTAKAEIGWCYVWGAVAATCTPSKRKAYLPRQDVKEQAVTIKKCQVLNGSKSACNGCKYYPNNETTLMDDCQGFVKQVFSRVGIKFSGGGCTTMYRNKSNWTEQDVIKKMPDKVCCVFMYNKDKDNYSHIGIHIGGGIVIHDSGEVKYGKITDRGWSHYALVKGLDGDVPVEFPTLRKGDKGEYVTLMQTKLIQLGYDLEPYGADGKFGNKTLAAVKQFQTDKGLKADGVCGSATWDALMSGEIELYTVTIPHLSKSTATELVDKYGGAMVKEGGDNNA